MDHVPNETELRLLFREAMANLPAAVNIVTTAGAAGRCGITATAVCSVSDTPPTLLFCLNRNSSTLPAFEQNRALCINVLPAECEELARHFAGMSGLPMEQRFAAARWRDDGNPLPRLEQALVSLSGHLVDTAHVGTHSVMFVQIDDIVVRRQADGLLYFDRSFRRLARQIGAEAA